MVALTGATGGALKDLCSCIKIPSTKAKEYGAYGGTLLGAGAGGFILFLFPENKKKIFLNKTKKLLHVPFKLEDLGSKIIYNIN